MENENARLMEIIKLAASIKLYASDLISDSSELEIDEQFYKKCSSIETNAYHITSLIRGIKSSALQEEQV